MGAVTPIKRDAAPVERYLSPKQVCELVPGMTVEMLADRRKRRLEPDYFKPTGDVDSRGLVVYAESDVLAWIASSRVQTRRTGS